MRILLTGGAGYIGSHTAVALAHAGHDIVIFDNFANSRPEAVERVTTIIGAAIPLVIGDVRDRDCISRALQEHAIEAVVHFAGLKALGESVANPLAYYDVNVTGTLRLIEAMAASSARTLVFSSSATVYGKPQYLPLDEGHPTRASNPYGRTKLIAEEMLADIAAAAPEWRIAILRYFNPVGAHDSGLIGEDPNGIPNNLMPFVCRVAAGALPELVIFGDDYPTPDGTGVRDYIHVDDLAAGHLAALERLAIAAPSLSTWNLGTGTGYSVRDIIRTFCEVNDVNVPYRVAARRSGDVATCYANPDKAQAELGWAARRDLADMCSSAWRFERLIRERNT
jgi:UDP-glucose 4-epimerase